MTRWKDWIKSVHGWLYFRTLPLWVQPPAVRYHGRVYSISRAHIMRFLDSWQGRIHGRVLDVGAGTWTYPRRLLQDQCEYTTADCFQHPNVDVVTDINHLSEVFPAGQFDFVICTDVLEHIPQPWIAVRQLYAVLKPDGILLLTVPFNYRLHGNRTVSDYWRMTETGLRSLLEDEAGFRELTVTPSGHHRHPFSYSVSAHK